MGPTGPASDPYGTSKVVRRMSPGEALMAAHARDEFDDLHEEVTALERDRLMRELKETILSSAYMVLLADGRVSARERNTLMKFAKALKISEVHRGIIFEDIERAMDESEAR